MVPRLTVEMVPRLAVELVPTYIQRKRNTVHDRLSVRTRPVYISNITVVRIQLQNIIGFKRIIYNKVLKQGFEKEAYIQYLKQNNPNPLA